MKSLLCFDTGKVAFFARLESGLPVFGKTRVELVLSFSYVREKVHDLSLSCQLSEASNL